MNEADFAFRVRLALNEGADSISYKAGLRLERARQLAVARARSAAAVAAPATVRLPALQVATASGPGFDGPEPGSLWAWLRGAGLAAPLVALVVGFVAIYQWHNQKFISELADVDFAVLLDETPISAYADKGFGAMLSRPHLFVPADDRAAADAAPAEPADGESTATASEPSSSAQ